MKKRQRQNYFVVYVYALLALIGLVILFVIVIGVIVYTALKMTGV